jgi:hypothetical protein
MMRKAVMECVASIPVCASDIGLIVKERVKKVKVASEK